MVTFLNLPGQGGQSKHGTREDRFDRPSIPLGRPAIRLGPRLKEPGFRWAPATMPRYECKDNILVRGHNSGSQSITRSKRSTGLPAQQQNMVSRALARSTTYQLFEQFANYEYAINWGSF